MSTKTSVWQSHSFVMGIICVVLALACVVVVAPTVQAINTAGMTGLELGLVQICQLVTTTAPIALIGGLAWSIFGYLRYKAGDATVNYSLTQLAQTITWFMGIITPLTYGLNSIQLNGVGIGTIVTQLFMIIKAVVNQAQAQSAGSTITPTPPALPTNDGFPPLVDILPESFTTSVGKPVQFTSQVSKGTPPYKYQWYLLDKPVRGANSDTWIYTPTTPTDQYGNGIYLIVTDAAGGTRTSNMAILIVNPA